MLKICSIRNGVKHPLFKRYLLVCVLVPAGFTAGAGICSSLDGVPDLIKPRLYYI